MAPPTAFAAATGATAGRAMAATVPGKQAKDALSGNEAVPGKTVTRGSAIAADPARTASATR